MIVYRCKHCAFQTNDGEQANVHEVTALGHKISFKDEVGRKYDIGKMRWSLFPEGTLIEVLRVLEAGAARYEANNWQKVENGRERYYNAAMRHIDAWWRGEELDPDPAFNTHHLANAICCLMFAMWLDFQNQDGAGEGFSPNVSEPDPKTEPRPVEDHREELDIEVDDIDEVKAIDICQPSVDLTPMRAETMATVFNKPLQRPASEVLKEVEIEREKRRLKRLEEIGRELDEASGKPQRVLDSHGNSSYVVPKVKK